jgi:hypothetical protein
MPDVVPPARSRSGWSASRRFHVPTEQRSRGPAVMRPPVAAGPTLVACPTGVRLQVPGAQPGMSATTDKLGRVRRVSQVRTSGQAVRTETAGTSLDGVPRWASGPRRTVRRPRWPGGNKK